MATTTIRLEWSIFDNANENKVIVSDKTAKIFLRPKYYDHLRERAIYFGSWFIQFDEFKIECRKGE